MAWCKRCQYLRRIHRWTRKLGNPLPCEDWECARGNWRLRWMWTVRISSLKWARQITPTTTYKYTPYGVKMANKALTKLLRWLHDYDPNMRYVVGLDRSPLKGLLHFNILHDGAFPFDTVASDYWHKLTGCHDTKIAPAHKNSAYYLAKRASELPNVKDGKLRAWREAKTLGFRRIRTSEGLFPKPLKTKQSGMSEWSVCFIGDDGYPYELLQRSRSMTANIATPGEPGNTADQSSLTGDAHGHESECRRQGILVKDVRIRVGRWGGIGDQRELDPRNEATDSAVMGAAK